MNKRLIPIAAAMLLAAPSIVQAQDGFMFGRPKAQATLRVGPALHTVGGDLFDFFRSELTLERGDFRAPAVAGEVSFFLHPRLDVGLSAAYSRVESRSEFREWVDEGPTPSPDDDLPIEQVTTLRITPVTISARFYPLSRGRSVSQLAWVPARTTPYVGLGAGVAWYRLAQQGDFVDSEDLGIFPATFVSSGHAPVGQVFAGLDHWFSARAGLNLEGRYTLGSAEPGDDFDNWDKVDLSGVQLGVGLAFRW